MAFTTIYQTDHGDTVEVDSPKLEAYKQAAHIQNVLGRHYNLTAHLNGVYTVQGDGLANLTFEPAENLN